MKKYISILFAVIYMAGTLAACGSADTTSSESADADSGSTSTAETSAQPETVSAAEASSAALDDAGTADDALQIVTTIFPEYDWIKNILGDNPAGAEVTMLLDSGVDLHSYQPTAEDIMKIADCDLFVYVGGESDEWVEDALQEATNENMVVVNLLEVLGDSVKEEEVVEGMQEEEHGHEEGEAEDADHEEGGEHAEDADHEEGEEHAEEGHNHEEGEVEFDEHVWLSLRNSAVLVEKLSEVLQDIDEDNASVYAENTAAYIDELNALDEAYAAAVSQGSLKTVLFGDRFPFRYLTDDYDLSYYAAFAGCSAETEASFETITFLAEKADELGLHTILTIEGTDHRIAETIVQSTEKKDQQILSMDSMQGTTAEDVSAGASYLSIMEDNLAVLEDALK